MSSHAEHIRLTRIQPETIECSRGVDGCLLPPPSAYQATKICYLPNDHRSNSAVQDANQASLSRCGLEPQIILLRRIRRAASIFASPSESHYHTPLLPEPCSFGLPLRLCRRPLEVKVPEDLGDEFAHLQDGDILANACPCSMAKLQ